MNKIVSRVSAIGGGLVALLTGASSVLAQTTNLTDNVDITTNIRYNGIQNITPSAFIRTAINLLLGIAGIIAFIFLLWGGLQWILAGGDKEGTEKARKRITSALIGLAIVFSAYALLFIIRALFGIDVISVNLGRVGTV